jgi:hypothetical protein
MAAIRHKLSARPSSGTPSAFSTRGGVVLLLKTFASIRPSRFRSPVSGCGALSRQKIGFHGAKAKFPAPLCSATSALLADCVIDNRHIIGVNIGVNIGVRAISVMPRPQHTTFERQNETHSSIGHGSACRSDHQRQRARRIGAWQNIPPIICHSIVAVGVRIPTELTTG